MTLVIADFPRVHALALKPAPNSPRVDALAGLAEGPAGTQDRPAQGRVLHGDVTDSRQQQVQPCGQVDRRFEVELLGLPPRSKRATVHVKRGLCDRPAIPGAALDVCRRYVLR